MGRVPRTRRRWAQAIAHLAGLAVVLAYGREFVVRGPWINDAHGFWLAAEGGLYDIPWLDHGAYVYSPAFAQAIAPLTQLSWEGFWFAWLVLQLAALVLVVGPAWAGVILLLPWPSIEGYPNAVVATINNGNPQLLLALAVAAALRWPAAVAMLLLTKVTPGIVVVWYLVRREWRRAGMALGATALIVTISFAVEPVLWVEWLSLLTASASADTLTKEPLLPLTPAVRLPIALAVLAWGALTYRYWTAAVAATLALPAIQLGGFAILVAAIPFLGLPLAPRWFLRPRDQAGEDANPPRMSRP